MAETPWMLLAAAGLVTAAGMAWLALAMDVHWQQVQGAAGPPRATLRLLRALGIVALAASAVLCGMADRPSMAALVWVMLVSGAAVSIALVLAWKPALLRVCWPVRTR